MNGKSSCRSSEPAACLRRRPFSYVEEDEFLNLDIVLRNLIINEHKCVHRYHSGYSGVQCFASIPLIS